MKVIYKYKLAQEMSLPKDFKVLKVIGDFMWAIVDPDAPKESWGLSTVGTGWIEKDNYFDEMVYLDTVEDGPYIWHLFLFKITE